MGAKVCYADEVIKQDDKLMFWFECKVCRNRWLSSFCFCPHCNKLNKYKILSSEQAIQEINNNLDFDDLCDGIIFGLILEEQEK